MLGLAVPSGKALRDLRRRIGIAPVRKLFETLAGPLGQPRTPGIMFGGYRTVSFDGCKSIKVADTAKNRAWSFKVVPLVGQIFTIGTAVLIIRSGAPMPLSELSTDEHPNLIREQVGPDCVGLISLAGQYHEHLAG